MSYRASFTILIMLLFAGCASRQAGDDLFFAPASQSILLQIENQNWLDVGVYQIEDNGTLPYRVATVSALASSRVRVRPRSARGTIRLLVRPIGSRQAHLTNQVLVSPGETVRLTVGNHLALTSLYVN